MSTRYHEWTPEQFIYSIAPDKSSNISKAVNKSKDTHLPPGNDPQKPTGGKPNWKCQKKREKKKNKKSIAIRPSAC